ncbi:hypothetical protein [uncultured Nostoc sp.]
MGGTDLLAIAKITPSIQSTGAHLTPIEQTFEGQHPQTPGS